MVAKLRECTCKNASRSTQAFRICLASIYVCYSMSLLLDHLALFWSVVTYVVWSQSGPDLALAHAYTEARHMPMKILIQSQNILWPTSVKARHILE